MLGFVTRDWRAKLLSVVLAVVAWVGVVYAANPPGVRTVQIHVPQPPAVSLPGGYVLVQPIPDVSVTVAGTQDHLNAFNLSFIQVSASYQVIAALGGRVPAQLNIPIKVTSTDSNVQLDNPPTSVQALVDRIGTATATVTPAVSSYPPPGYSTGTTTISPSTVTLTGPEHELLGATVRTSTIDLANQRGDFSATLNVYAYDSQGQRLAGVNTSPPSVNVQIAVKQLNSSRTSAVLLGPLRGLAPGAVVTSISYSPMTVTLTGALDQVNDASLNSITTAPIDLGGLTGTHTYVVAVPPPEAGVTVSPSTVTVSVTITITAVPTSTPAATSSPTPAGSAQPTPTPSPGG